MLLLSIMALCSAHTQHSSQFGQIGWVEDDGPGFGETGRAETVAFQTMKRPTHRAGLLTLLRLLHLPPLPRSFNFLDLHNLSLLLVRLPLHTLLQHLLRLQHRFTVLSYLLCFLDLCDKPLAKRP